MLVNLLDQAHHAETIGDIRRIVRDVKYSPELEAELYGALHSRCLDKHQSQMVGMLITHIYNDGRDGGSFDVEYLGFGSSGVKLEGKNCTALIYWHKLAMQKLMTANSTGIL